jgi:hypothetical protein
MSARTNYYFSLLRRKAVIAAIVGGAMLGIAVLGTVRFVTVHHNETHYHANIAVYIDGLRQEFKGPQYYQEISACDEHASPLGRVHLHDGNPGLVHVHDTVVTWADLFANIGWSLNDSVLFDGKQAYVNDQNNTLSFILNGKPIRSVANEIIGDKDRLLISYGADDNATLQKQFGSVPTDAAKADVTADPATCQGAEHKDMWTELRQAFLF